MVLFPEAIASIIGMLLASKLSQKVGAKPLALSALLNTVKQIGTSIGITIITSVLQQRQTFDYAVLSGQINAFNPNSVDLYNLLQGWLIQGSVFPSSA
jgi:hypothetical protein